MASTTAASPARIQPESIPVPLTGQRDNPITFKIRKNGAACFRVLGQSMFPWIRSGDYVYVRRCAMASVSRGDVVLYERGRRLFVHRVVKLVRDRAHENCVTELITKGDALDGRDAPVTESEFLGRVTRIHRGRRHIDLEFLGRIIFGRLLAVTSPASFLLYGPLRTVRRFLFT